MQKKEIILKTIIHFAASY